MYKLTRTYLYISLSLSIYIYMYYIYIYTYMYMYMYGGPFVAALAPSDPNGPLVLVRPAPTQRFFLLSTAMPKVAQVQRLPLN